MVPRSAAFVNGKGKMPAAPLQPLPRTCAIFSMSTSEASCHGCELSRAVTRRELTAEALRRPGKALRCFPSFFPGCRPVRARARSKLFCKKVSSKNFMLASLGPRRARALVVRTGVSVAHRPLARIDNPGTGRSFQMSRSYSATERSEEKYPALAIFTSIFLAQAARSS